MGLLVGEKSLTKLASAFASEAAAVDAAAAISAATGLGPGQARVLTPADAKRSRRELFGLKVQPESQGILRTFLRSHIVLGALGAMLGAGLWWAFRAHPLVASSPVMALVAAVGFGITFGLLAAGLITLRPDQAALFSQIQSKLRTGQWAVIFHPTDPEQTDAIRTALQARQLEVLSSL